MKKNNRMAKKKSKTKPRKVIKNKHGIRTSPSKSNTIHIALHVMMLMVTVFGVFVSIFYTHPNPFYFILTLFLFFFFVEMSFCVYWYIKKPNKKNIIFFTFLFLFLITVSMALILPSRFIKKTSFPTFTDAINNNFEPVFSLGTSGMSFSGVNIPIKIGEYVPFRPHIENNKLYVDVKIFSKTGFPPIKIINNKLYNLPLNWDRNSNDIALEIVNENLEPIYQLVYKKPFNINIKGIFPSPSGVIIADDTNGISIISYDLLQQIPVKFKLKRIFKYPSWRYPGEYDN